MEPRLLSVSLRWCFGAKRVICVLQPWYPQTWPQIQCHRGCLPPAVLTLGKILRWFVLLWPVSKTLPGQSSLFTQFFRLSAHSLWRAYEHQGCFWCEWTQASAARLQNNLMHGPFTLLFGPLDGRILRTVSPPSSWENQISSSPNPALVFMGVVLKALETMFIYILYAVISFIHKSHIRMWFFSYFVTPDINDIPNIFCNVYLILKVCIFLLSLFLGQNSLVFLSISSYFHSDICYSMNAI